MRRKDEMVQGDPDAPPGERMWPWLLLALALFVVIGLLLASGFG